MGVTVGDGGRCLLAIDAGNSKTDVAVVTTDGTLLARERAPASRRTLTASTRAVEVAGGHRAVGPAARR